MVRCRFAGGVTEALTLEKYNHGFAAILIVALQIEFAMHCGMVRCRIVGGSDRGAMPSAHGRHQDAPAAGSLRAIHW